MTESATLRAIVNTLETLGFTVIRVQSGTRGGGRMRLAGKGTPDLCVLGQHGQTTWMEVKSPVGTVDPAQLAWLTKHRDRGHRVVIVRSVQDALAAVGRG